MTDDHPEHHHQPQVVVPQNSQVSDTPQINIHIKTHTNTNEVTQKATVIQPPHTGVTSVMPGPPSLPIPTEIITKPGPISKTLKSSAAASEEPPTTPVAIM